MAKFHNSLFPITLLILTAAGTACAQNSDLGLLLGVIAPRYEVVAGPSSHVSASAGAAGQINYSYEIKGTPHGDLYLEFPVFLAARGATFVSSSVPHSSTNGTGIGAVVPGLRYKLPLGGRVSVYAGGGAGIGWFEDNEVLAGGVVAIIRGSTTATAAFDFGGGMDLRLTRLLSLRGEVRDLVTSRRSLSNSAGRNNPVYSFGLGFHF